MRKRRKVDPEKEKYWRDVFRRFQKSGLPFKKFCAAEKISSNTFQYWRKELRTRDEEQGKASTISKGDNRPSQLAEKIKFWKQIVDDLEAYSGSASSFCRERKISSGTLHYWTRRLKDEGLLGKLAPAVSDVPHAAFVPVQIRENSAGNSEKAVHGNLELRSNDPIQITLSDGTSISASPEIPVDTLLTLINGLRLAKT